MRFVYPKVGKDSNMVLIEALNNGSTDLTLHEPLIVHDESGYTDEIKAIFNFKKEDTDEAA
jgi:tRNA1(Val) A37 N6-methylase TrmN6